MTLRVVVVKLRAYRRYTARTLAIRSRNMNVAHNMLCSSEWWARRVKSKLVPWGVAGVELNGDVLEIGPGFGATTRELAPLAGSLTVVEQDERYCRKLRAAF